MKHLRILALAATALIGAASAASAQQAYTTGDVNMRAGPGSRYPVVTSVPEDALVYIHGCLSDWDWCDVSWRRNRGWVFSDYLEALYHNRRIGFDEYRGYVDIPYVTFGFGYWDRYYRDRPWFDSWDRWGDRHDRMRWRERNHDGDNGGDNGGDWGHDGPDGHDMNRGDSGQDGDVTMRRDRRGQDGNRNRFCAPDDPTCDQGDRNDRRDRRTDQQDMMDQPD